MRRLAHDIAQFLINIVVPGCHLGGCNEVAKRCVVSHEFVESSREIGLRALRRFDPPGLRARADIVVDGAAGVFLATQVIDDLVVQDLAQVDIDGSPTFFPAEAVGESRKAAKTSPRTSS